MTSIGIRSILQFSQNAYIIFNNENVLPLKQSLSGEGFNCTLIQGPYTSRQENFSASMKCLVNHSNAWRCIVASRKPGLIVEADFVPVTNFSSLPIPAPAEHEDMALCYFYACGPQFWDIAISRISARGHAGATVAYAISPAVANLMLKYFVDLTTVNPVGHYYTWDSEIGYWLKERGVQSFIPYKNYGEHGGQWNPEHGRAGLPRPHRADVLISPLSFLPFYASSNYRFYLTRTKAYLYGLARLALGRLISLHDIKRNGGRRLMAETVLRFNPVSPILSTINSRLVLSCAKRVR
jgi:hypothetical protein